MRVVLLTTRSWFAFVLLRRLKSYGIDVDAVVIEDPPVGTRLGRAVRDLTPAALGALVLRKVRACVLRDKDLAWERFEAYRPLCGRVCVVRDLNSPASEEILRELAPDVVVLGRCRILRKRIIDIPRVGVLNAHPGMLPAYRGLDTIEWAVHNGEEPGVTVHFVDPGIDTGPIVIQQKLPLQLDDSLRSLYGRAADISGTLLSGVLARLAAGEALTLLPQRREAGRRCHPMPRHLRRETERILARKVSRFSSLG